ncbi:GvpL/GvpF family gas vesicle protein [Halobacillus sp. A5]|uniref:GvpL/GvpF family gas vesicle protein n=1 Tax=Halobacillus sp. A5 TaxID=2880263 RepID=UPI0020A69282|nr:GvpL/GvpF family gas vesicle protein [Halobacillus sp. A5]MCP3026945.1 GvpL/GvpF family gas vesicle protein [Halobacillus sp. A5]
MSLYVYLYGVIPTPEDGDNPFSSHKGIDNEHELQMKNYGDISAVFCHVEEEEYGEEVLQEKTNQMDWVQEKAFHHHEILMNIRERTALIPMKFCTIYQSEANLDDMVHNHQDQMKALIERLDGKEEWNLKVYCDRDQLSKNVADHNLNIKEKKDEIAQMSKGRQYLESRKLDQYVQQEVEREQDAFGSALHEQLTAYSVEDTVKKNWNRDVTGKDEEMCWNSAYLVPLERVEDFLEIITNENEKHKSSGWILEATGPWPAYHFAKLT